MKDPRFAENIFRPVHIPDNPEPQPVPLLAYFGQEMAPSSRQTESRERCIAVQVIRRRARGPHG